MAPTPAEYQIVKNLQAALLAISLSAGYHFDVARLAVKLDPNHDVDSLIAPDGPRPFIVVEMNPDEWQYSPARLVSLTLPFTINWISDYVPTDDDSRIFTFLAGCADVERAIAGDISRGGLARDTRIVKRSYDTAVDGAQVWARVEGVILTRRTYGQPDA